MRVPPFLLRTTHFSISSRYAFLTRNHPRVPKHTSASSSVQSGHYFVNPLRHVTPDHSAGVFSSPIAQARGYVTETDGTSKPRKRPPFKPQRGFKKPRKEETTEPIHQFNGIPQPIPGDTLDPPERVKGWPTPIISQYEVDKYLRPLYKRGWSIEFRRKKHLHCPDRYYVPSLQLYFENLSWDQFFPLAEFIRKLEDSEKHNVEWKYQDKTGLDFRSLHNLGLPLPPTVVLLLRTHTAILIRNRGANDIIEDVLADKTIEGITLRDMRFAILLDAFIRQYNADPSTRSPIMIRQEIKGLGNASRHTRLDGLLNGTPRDMEPTVWRKRKRGPKKLVDADFYLGSEWSAILDQRPASELS